MSKYHLIKKKKKEFEYITCLNDVKDIINAIELRYDDPIKYLEDITPYEFEERVLLNEYNPSYYIIEDTNKVLVYKVKTVISTGYLYNSVYKEFKIVDEYYLALEEN